MNNQFQSEPNRNSQLRQLMDAAFNLDELQTLCFDLGYDYDKFGGDVQGKTAVIRKIIEYADSQNQLEKLIAACAATAPSHDWPLVPQPNQPCPYRGLFAFREEDQDLFLGRETFTGMLTEFVLARPLTAVIGPSGSGKSSVVFAGLVPALRQQSDWLVLKFRPGERPFHTLAAVLLPHLDPALSKVDQLAETKKLATRLRDGDLNLADIIPTILEMQPANTRLLLIADQFEELFTLCPDTATRHHFFDLLLTQTSGRGDSANRPYIVCTLRADFMGQALAYPPLVAALQNNDVKLGPMTPGELRRAIVEPAKQANVQFEEGLVERILDDVGTDGRNLPLLEFALTELWQQQTNHRLTHTAYERIGQVRGALARHADTVYESLTSKEQAQAERIFVQLVHPGAGAEDTRRLATKADIDKADWALVQQLADANTRLLVTDQNESNQETAEVIHEALIQRWQRLQSWMDTHREFRAWQERLRTDLKQWQSNNQDEGYLLRGAPLAVAQTQLSKNYNRLSVAETEFIEASTIRQHKLEAEEQTRQQLESKRFRRLSAALTVALLIAGAALWATFAQLRVASARQLSTEAQIALNNDDPYLATLLALEANKTIEIEEATDLIERMPADGMVPAKGFYGHSDWVRSVAWSNDGRLASGSDDGTVILWDTDTGLPAQTLTGHSDSVLSVAWSNDGSLASGSDDGSIILWDVETGLPAQILFGHLDSVTSIAWSNDGRLASASANGNIILWDIESGEPTQTLQGHSSFVTSISWSADGRLASAASVGGIILWDIESGQPAQTLFGHFDSVTSLAWSNDGRLVSGSRNRSIFLWDIDSAEPTQTLAGHSFSVESVAWASDGRLASASSDGTIILWDVESGQPTQTLQGHSLWVNSIAWSRDGRLATASSDQTVILWDTGPLDTTLSGHWDWVESVAWASDGRLASGSDDGTIILWDIGSGMPDIILPSHWDYVTSVAWSSDGRLASASFDLTVIVWDVGSGLPNTILSGHSAVVRSVAWSSDGRLASSSDDGTIIIWDIDTGQPAQTLTSHSSTFWSVAWSPDGRLASASDDGNIIIWNIESGQPAKTLQGHSIAVGSVSWSNDNRLASASADGTIILWDTESGQPAKILQSHSPYGASIAWSPDGRLASGFDDGTIILWNLDSGLPTQTLRGHSSWISSIAWSPDGWLASSSADLTVRIIPETFTHPPCSWALRNLSEAEWLGYKAPLNWSGETPSGAPPSFIDFFSYIQDGQLATTLNFLSIATYEPTCPNLPSPAVAPILTIQGRLAYIAGAIFVLAFLVWLIINLFKLVKRIYKRIYKHLHNHSVP